MVIHSLFHVVPRFLFPSLDQKYLKLLIQFIVQKIIIIGIFCDLLPLISEEKKKPRKGHGLVFIPF
jgi:hypothetical protein